jgi:hypothetical protein
MTHIERMAVLPVQLDGYRVPDRNFPRIPQVPITVEYYCLVHVIIVCYNVLHSVDLSHDASTSVNGPVP